MATRTLLAAVLLVAALAAGCTGDDLPVVTVEEVTAGDVTETVAAPARVDAAARQDVAAGVSGVVVAVEAADGDAVTGGQAIVRLQSAQVALAQEQARAAEAAAAGAGGIAVDSGADTTAAQARQAVAELDASVGPQLAAARAAADAVAEEGPRAAATAAVDAAEASYLATRTAILATGETVAAQQDAIAHAIASALNQAIEQAAAPQRAQAAFAAQAAAVQANDLTLTAPFDGTVQLGEAAASDGLSLPAGIPPELAGAAAGLGGGLSGIAGAEGGGTLRVGAPVVAGQTLFTVYDLSQTFVNADIDEVDAPLVRAGQDVVVLVDAFPDVEFVGVVEGIEVEAATTEAGGVGYPARIRLLGRPAGAPDPAGLRVGMTAGVEIVANTVSSDLVVPSRALLRREDATVVFVLRDDDEVALVEVTEIAVGADLAAVTGALEVGNQVVTSGYEDLAAGDRVAVERG